MERKEDKTNEVRTKDEYKQRDKLIYEIVVSRYEQELERTNDLDSKASNVTGFTGLLITLMTAIPQLIELRYEYLFIIPLIPLVFSAIFGLWAYWTKTFSGIQPNTLIDEYKESSETKLLREFTKTTAENVMTNHEVNNQKVKLIKRAFVSLVLAIGLFFCIAIIGLASG
jgi:hypothetical protein